MSALLDKLKGGDLRSIGRSNAVVRQIHGQPAFDQLFKGMFDDDRLVVMRSADAIEKITALTPRYLKPHKKSLIRLIRSARDKELKWHLALLVSRVALGQIEIGEIWHRVTGWATDGNESKIVRVNSVQCLFELLKQYPRLTSDFRQTLVNLESQGVPSITARIKKLKKQMGES